MTSSKIFQDLSSAEIDKVIQNLYGSKAKIVACRMLKGGLFNTTYYVKTSSDRTGIVLRVAPINQHLLLDFEKDMMSAEPAFYELLKAKNIPSAEVIHYDGSLNVIDREYIIFRYIPSVPLNTALVPEEAQSKLYQELGKIIAALHEIRSEKFGWQRPKGELVMYDKWSAFLQRFATEIADKASMYNIFSDRDLRRFLRSFSNQPIFDQIENAHMVHADLWAGNVLVSENNDGQWDVVALIDVDKAIFGDRDWEFSSSVMRNKDFLQGYGSAFDKSTSAIFRRSVYQLLERFMYAYIWQVQFENFERYQAAKSSGLAILAKIEATAL